MGKSPKRLPRSKSKSGKSPQQTKKQWQPEKQWEPYQVAVNKLIPLAEAFEVFSSRSPNLLDLIFFERSLDTYDFEGVRWFYEYFRSPDHAQRLVQRVADSINKFLALPFPQFPREQLDFLIIEEENQKDEEAKQRLTEEGENLLKDFQAEYDRLRLSEEYRSAIGRVAQTGRYLRQLASMIMDQREPSKTGVTKNIAGTIPRQQKTEKIRETNKGLSLDDTGLFINGKHFELTPNAMTMWKLFFDVGGKVVHQNDFPGFEARKVIKTMPPAVRKIILHGKPHQGYSVPKLRVQSGSTN